MALALAALAGGLGAHALIDPDEGRNAGVALGMVEAGDYLLPRLDGLPHLDKPFLYYAVTAASLRLLGASEWAARLPSLLAVWATAALVAAFAARLWGRRAGWIAGTACATSPMMVAYSRIVIFDALLGLFVTLALIAFYQAVERTDPPGWRARSAAWCSVAWLAMALGTLTKGPVALAVPLLAAVPYALWRRRGRALWHPAGPALFVAVVLPWVLAVEAREPGFLRYALWTETWQRLTTDRMERTGPVWYFLPFLVGGTFPWIVPPLVSGLRRLRRLRWSGSGAGPRAAAEPALVFLLLWIALPLLLFSLSQSKRPHYVLPLVPAVALLAARVWTAPRPPALAVRLAAAGWLLLGGLLVAMAAFPGELLERAGPGIVAGAVPFAAFFGALASIAGAVALRWARHRALAPVALSLPLIALPLLAPTLLATVARERSARQVAAAVAPHLTPDTAVIGVETFPASLTFYLDRSITVSTDDPRRLGSNYVLASGVGQARTASVLRPSGWWLSAARECGQPAIFIVERPFEPWISALRQAGLPLIHAGPDLAALGPCRPPAAPRTAGTGRLSKPAAGGPGRADEIAEGPS
jgi:4-amino-4-deoxy-L-arabinose transferase-like glycosyltransferase